MANTIKKGESLFIPFKNGESIYDSQLKPRMYKTKEQYDRFSYRFDDAEMVEYAEVVRCKDCIYNETGSCSFSKYVDPASYNPNWFCADGERKYNEKQAY